LVKEQLQKTINDLNQKIEEFKKAIDALIAFEVMLNKKHHLDAGKFFGQIDEMK
jgi:hypothetical protein